jgi:protoporphyrinogen oxidase
VIGAGPAGLTCALQLARKDMQVTVLEAAPEVGGMARSFELWGQLVDFGPHRFFSLDPAVDGFWKNEAGGEIIHVDRLTRIFYGGKFFLYPVQAMDALTKLGFWKAAQCAMSYFLAQMRKKGNEKTFEEWVSKRFGWKLYSIFFKSYSERLWGIPCTKLDAAFAAQRIKGLTLMEVIKNALFGKGGSKHKTLVDRFAYPKLGCGQVYTRMSKELEALGGGVLCGKTVKRILVDTRDGVHCACGVELVDGSRLKSDVVVSSAPLTDMVLGIPQLSNVHEVAKRLHYRNTTLVYLRVRQKEIFKDNWIYVHEKQLQTGRICNFRNWSPYMRRGSDDAILCLEYWSNDEDGLWRKSDEELIGLGKADLALSGLVTGENIVDGFVHRMHRSYPVYELGYNEHLREIQKETDKIGHLYFIGRNGSFKYNNQDHSILMGLLAAENIADGARHNLWTVNTDYDYQEGAAIEPAGAIGKHSPNC